MKQKHSVPVQIRFNDIDLMGHVYNAKYQEFFDLARLNYFKTVLGELISWTHKGLIIASVKVDTCNQLFWRMKFMWKHRYRRWEKRAWR